MSHDITTDLVTLRDYWRYAISRFNAAELSYGHGTHTAVDDAAFLILDSLDLPIDTLDPFLDAKLLPAERRLLAERIETRVAPLGSRTLQPTPPSTLTCKHYCPTSSSTTGPCTH